jgi:hypothetical protein
MSVVFRLSYKANLYTYEYKNNFKMFVSGIWGNKINANVERVIMNNYSCQLNNTCIKFIAVSLLVYIYVYIYI